MIDLTKVIKGIYSRLWSDNPHQRTVLKYSEFEDAALTSGVIGSVPTCKAKFKALAGSKYAVNYAPESKTLTGLKIEAYIIIDLDEVRDTVGVYVSKNAEKKIKKFSEA